MKEEILKTLPHIDFSSVNRQVGVFLNKINKTCWKRKPGTEYSKVFNNTPGFKKMHNEPLKRPAHNIKDR